MLPAGVPFFLAVYKCVVWFGAAIGGKNDRAVACPFIRLDSFGKIYIAVHSVIPP